MGEFPVEENQLPPIDKLLFQLLYSPVTTNFEIYIKESIIGEPGWTVQILQEPDYYAVSFLYKEKESPMIKHSIKYHALGDYNNTVYQAGRILEILNGEPV
jgi:hypothetical protein